IEAPPLKAVGPYSVAIEAGGFVHCSGQIPLRELAEPLEAKGIKTHVIGGADEAAELDAKRAIDQGARLAATL
ncbi:MAG: hypothetical protein AAFV19_25260, partial [Pseudomonadota bacterium]